MPALRQWLVTGAIALAAVVAFVISPPLPEQPPPAIIGTTHESPPLPPRRPPLTAHPSLVMATEFLAPEGDAERDGEILETLLGDFARAFGENPAGENEEIMAALQGANSKGLRFFPAEHRGLSTEGKILDRWGTPWFFHALSGKNMEILSAGPDREFGTGDDLHAGSGRQFQGDPP